MLESTLWALLTANFKGIDIKGEGHEKRKTVNEKAAARKNQLASEGHIDDLGVTFLTIILSLVEPV